MGWVIKLLTPLSGYSWFSKLLVNKFGPEVKEKVSKKPYIPSTLNLGNDFNGDNNHSWKDYFFSVLLSCFYSNWLQDAIIKMYIYSERLRGHSQRTSGFLGFLYPLLPLRPDKTIESHSNNNWTSGFKPPSPGISRTSFVNGPLAN